MNEKDFLYTLKEYLKSELEYEILDIVEKCQLTFNYTSAFATKTWQFRAYVDIRVPISKLVRAKSKEVREKLVKYCGEIFVDDDQYAFYGIDIKPLIMSREDVEEVSDSKEEGKVVIEETKKETCREKRLNIKLGEKTIEAIAQILTGDNGKSFYRKGYELVTFFNNLGCEDVYNNDFPTRIVYAREKIKYFNQKGRIVDVLEEILDPRSFIQNEEALIESVQYLNLFLKFDGYMLVSNEEFYKLKKYEDSRIVRADSSAISERTSEKKDISKTETKEIKIFFSYSHKDEAMRDELEKHLIMLKRKGIIKTWHDRKIDGGGVLEKEIDSNLKEANIILLLISVDFLVSDYCYENEMMEALRMHENKQAIVVPIILRPCDWASAPFSKLLALPKDGKNVSAWAQQDEAFYNIAKGIENIALKL